MTVIPTSLNIDWSGITLPDPKTVNDGKIGKLVEEYLDSQGFNIQQGHIIDLPDFGTYGIEVKSKQLDSNTDYTIGATTLKNILEKSWEESHFSKKLKVLLMVEVARNNEGTGYVKRHYLVNFLDSEIQKLLSESYEIARSNLKNNTNPKRKDGGKYGHFELRTHEGKTDSYAFRITKSSMKLLIRKSLVSRNRLFEFG